MNLALREYVNGALLPLNFFVLFIISRQLLKKRASFGKGWSREPGIASACALWWIFVADFVRSGLAWSALHDQAIGHADSFLHVSYYRAGLWFFAGAIAAAGTFRLIYTLGPASWGHLGWISAMVLTPLTVFVLSILG